MTKSLILLLSAILFLPLASLAAGADIFPYQYKIEVLDNGLKVISIPLPNPNIISYYTIVRSGSRNEIEPGKSGFAHFFEHIMFKGTKKVPKAAYNKYLTRLGAGTNGFTTDDFTCYFTVFAGRNNLQEVVETEADRFINLWYDEEMIKTEAPVIEGEYYASVSSPGRRINELLYDTAFDKHSYKHTTLGYLKDIKDMPNQHGYSQLYKKRFYAPDNIILLIVGDFDHAQLMELVRKNYGGWRKSGYVLQTPVEPPQKEARRANLDWKTKTLGRLNIGFHGPAYSDEMIDKAALDLLAEAAFTSSSPIYQKLVIQEQKCQALGANFGDNRDPNLLVFSAILKNDADLGYVEEEILKELERLKTEPVPAEKLAAIKSNLKYSVASQLETTDGVAGVLAQYIQLTGDPGTLNRLFDLYEKITPADIQAIAMKYFVKTNSTVATLKTGGAK